MNGQQNRNRGRRQRDTWPAAVGFSAMPVQPQETAATEVATLKAQIRSQGRLVASLEAELAASAAASADARTALKAVADLLCQRDAAIEVLSHDLVETRAELEAALAAVAAAKAKAARTAALKEERAIQAAWNHELPVCGHAESQVPQEHGQKRFRGSRGRGGGKKRRKEEYQAWLLQNPWWIYG